MYSTEHIHSSLAMTDEKTFRKWSKIFVQSISELEYEVVSSFSILKYISMYLTLSSRSYGNVDFLVILVRIVWYQQMVWMSKFRKCGRIEQSSQKMVLLQVQRSGPSIFNLRFTEKRRHCFH